MLRKINELFLIQYILLVTNGFTDSFKLRESYFFMEAGRQHISWDEYFVTLIKNPS